MLTLVPSKACPIGNDSLDWHTQPGDCLDHQQVWRPGHFVGKCVS